MLVRTNAIVLRRMRYSDTSIIATLLTEDRGIESVLAKGARSPKSRLAGVLEPLEQLEVLYYIKPGRELHILRSAERTRVRQQIQTSYDHTIAALKIAELVLNLELPSRPEPEVYRLATTVLATLDAAQQGIEAFPIAFALRIAAVHGFPLQLDYTRSDMVLQQFTFNIDRGTIEPFQHETVMPHSQGSTMSGGELIDERTVAALQALAHDPLENFEEKLIDSGTLDKCRRIAERYVEYHFERRLWKGNQSATGRRTYP
jgi:DNA repair protein RecO (recombination protein O)